MKKFNIKPKAWVSIPKDTHLSILVFLFLTGVSNLTIRAGVVGLFPQLLGAATLAALVVMVVLSVRDVRSGDAFRSSRNPERF